MTIAGVLQTFRVNHGGDLSTKCPTRPPNSRDGAVCDAALQNKTSRRWGTLCVSNSRYYFLFRSVLYDRHVFKSMGFSYFYSNRRNSNRYVVAYVVPPSHF